MYKKINLSVAAIALLLSTGLIASENEDRERMQSVRDAIQSVSEIEEKDVSVVTSMKQMFTEGKVTGQIRSMYSSYDNDNASSTYAAAVGGQLKYELADLYGFNAAAAFSTTYDMGFATGNGNKQNDGLSGSEGDYTDLTEAYINYKYKGLNLRAGRQIIDTPLADSDDIRMIPNTFEAYIATYEQNSFSLMAGHLTQWQGTDTGLDNSWVSTGKDGVNFGGVSYAHDYVDVSVWYYDISNASNEDILAGADENGNESIYIDAIGHLTINDDISFHAGAQYLKQSEQDGSNVQASIYGALAELVVYDLGFNINYNKSFKEDGKHSFSGYGGGTLFTNMDIMILDEITQDRDSIAIVAGLSYAISDFNLLYAYGDFSGDEDSSGLKAHIVEQNIGIEYTPNDEITLGSIVVIEENKEYPSSTDFNSVNFRVYAAYTF